MSKKKTIISWALVILAIAAVAFVEARTRSPLPKPTNAPPERSAVEEKPAVKIRAKAPVSPQGNSAQLRIESALITLRTFGFEPNDITRPAGRLLLIVDNRSGSPEMLLRIDRVAGARLREVRIPHKILDWYDILDMTPGQYVLSEANHPDWICHITITPK